MFSATVYRQAFLVLVLLALALQIAVPRGYMPAAVGSGAHLQLCGDAFPRAVLAALLGADHHHHHHHGDQDADADDLSRSCELAGLFAEGLQAAIILAVVEPCAAFYLPKPRTLDSRFERKPRHRPRAPPLS
ncbi:MAG: DUF2946 family protein [Pseudomonadota bacterium]